MNKYPAVYILANKRNGTLYTGITSDLVKRIYQHKYEKLISFAQYYERMNPNWFDLYETLF